MSRDIIAILECHKSTLDAEKQFTISTKAVCVCVCGCILNKQKVVQYFIENNMNGQKYEMIKINPAITNFIIDQVF